MLRPVLSMFNQAVHKCIQARKAQRFLCHPCHMTFSARQGTVCSRLRTSAETVVIVVTLLAHECPLQAMGAALGVDERTIADWWARSDRQGHAAYEALVEHPRALGQVQADERRVTQQGGIVWMALAMMGKTRLWLVGDVSEQRDLRLIQRLSERIRRCATPRPLLVYTDGWCTSIRAMRETCRDPGYTGPGGQPRLHSWRHVLSAPVGKRYERRRVIATERRMVDGPPAPVETLRWRSQGNGVINTADIEQLNATCRERLAPLARRCRALARQTLTGHEGMIWVGTVSNFCTRLTSVSTPASKPRQPWRRGSLTRAGRCRNCGRFLCRRRVGPRPSGADAPHEHCNA